MLPILLKGIGLQMQTGRFLQAEQKIHILNGLPRSAFQQIIDGGMNDELPVLYFQLDQAFIGIDHLFQGDSLAAEYREWVATVKIFI